MRPPARFQVLAVALLALTPGLAGSATGTGGDCGSGGDASPDRGAPTLLTAPVSCEGEWADAADIDAYGVFAYEGQTIQIELASEDGDAGLCLQSDEYRGSAIVECGSVVTLLLPRTGVWQIVLGGNTGAASYHLGVALADGPVDDCFSGRDASDTAAAATQTRPGTPSCPATVTSGDVDWYAFHVDAGEIIVLSTGEREAQVSACVFPPGALARASACAPDGVPLRVPAPVSGTWRVRIAQTSGTGHYLLTILATQGAGLVNDFPDIAPIRCAGGLTVTCRFVAFDDSPRLVYTMHWGDGTQVQAPLVLRQAEPGRIQTLTHTFAAPGTYPLRLVVDDFGNVLLDTQAETNASYTAP